MGGLSSARAVAPAGAALVAVLLFLSGCVGGGGKNAGVNAPAATARFDDSTGGIQGMVLDEENTPVVGAQVGILELGVSTATDGGGAFAFSNVVPGEHVVEAAAVGYVPTRVTVDVIAGELARPEITLVRMRAETSRSVVEIREGFISCGTGTYVVTQVACGAADANQKFLFRYNITMNMTAALWEMKWQSTQALSKDLVLNLEKNGCGATCNRSSTFGSAHGCCYLRVLLNATQLDVPFAKLHTQGGIMQSRTFPAFQTSDGLPTVYTSQKFILYTEYFYGPLPADLEKHSNVPT